MLLLFFSYTNSAKLRLNKEDGEIKVYKSARTKQLDSYKEALENEILAMNKMGQ